MRKDAKILRTLRLDKRLTQSEVAAKLKVSQSYYSAIERGLAKASEIEIAIKEVNNMRSKSNRTAGGDKKAGRVKI